MNGITYNSSGVEDNKNVLMAYNCKKTRDNSGVWLELYEMGFADPCASIYMNVADLRALAMYLDSVADDLVAEREVRDARIRQGIEAGKRFHDYDPDEKHIDEY